MDEENLKSWAAQPDVCRCCLSSSGTWDLTALYVTNLGIKEIFSDILQECYGITLSYLSEWGPSHLICNLCVGHLRDASAFRKRVLKAEECFVEYFNKKQSQTAVKLELGDDSECCNDHLELEDTSVVEENHNILKTETDPQQEQTIKPENENYIGKSKKALRSRRKKKDDSDYDSDVPIAELTKKKQHPDDIEENLQCEKILDDSESAVEDIKHKGKLSKKEIQKNAKLSSESYIDNEQIRSNICLVLKHSSIVPFKYSKNYKYVCLYCSQSYLFFDRLRDHVKEKHEEITDKEILTSLKTPKDLVKADVSEIKCKNCQEVFKSIDDLIEHLVETHKKKYYQTLRVKPSYGVLGFDLSSEKFTCHICSTEFRFFKNLSIHMNEHSSHYICHVCGKKFVSDHRLQTHVTTHKTTDNKCRFCGKGFHSASARNYHIRKDHKVTKLKCSECDEVFDQYHQRLRHLVEVHKLKKPDFRCEICSKDFASSGGLRAHVRYSHLRSKEFPCDICGKVFVYKWIWQRHLDVHTGTKNYECKFCNKRFGKPYTLRVHLRIHLNDKRFTCNICNAAFVQKCSLKNHFRVHHPDAVNTLS